MMNFVGEEQKENYFDKEEAEEEEDEKPFISFSSSSSSSAANSPNYSQNLSLFGAFDQSQQTHKNQDAQPFDFDSNKNLDLMELSLGGHSSGRSSAAAGGGGGGSIEKEHMFDKVVTPSDVGKLNRLVIPKQHAEKYFPLNSSSTEKGLLLNFEDRNGKAWRFRYSYWNSSQSYVMTKGWSRFVKEKKLDAGDVVSFQRGVGDLAGDRLFIDWRRRPNPLKSTPIQFQFPFPQEVQWGRIYSMPPPQQLGSISQQFENFPNSMNGNLYPYHYNFQQQQRQQQQQHEPIVGYGNRVLQQYHSRSPLSSSLVQEGGNLQPMVINSVPVMHGTKAMAPLKRLRLFGVNMEYGSSTAQDEVISPHLASAGSSSSSPSKLRVPVDWPMQQIEFSKKGKSSSTFDFDL